MTIDKGIVASGHPLVSEAAVEIMRAGGNAFDAVVAAGFVSAVVEPALTSLGGGGFLLAHNAQRKEDVFFDFFVDTPGLGADSSNQDPHFFPVTVHFSGSDQDFNVGLGSVAVPGTLKGLLHIQERMGIMGLSDILAPAITHARGYKINHQQAHFFKLLYPIMTLTDIGRSIYEPDGGYVKEGEMLVNSELVGFLQQVSKDKGESFYQGDIAAAIANDMQKGQGLLTTDDLAAYQVRERKPLNLSYRGMSLVTSPPPSLGGTLIGLSLSLLEKEGKPGHPWGSAEHLIHTTGLMAEVEDLRTSGLTTPEALEAFLAGDESYPEAVENIRLFSRGTTHISVADSNGNCASMTCSNGEGAGYFAPGTGVMLNNMMGEDDLHPDGFHSAPPGQRVASMMSPSMLVDKGKVKLVIGSGGSKRIRTAVSQVLSQVVDFGRPLQQAVDAPRLYLDGDIVQLEPGFSDESVAGLKKNISAKDMTVNQWQDIDVYFGGVHAVIPGKEGAGDPRRGGSVAELLVEEDGQRKT